MILMLMLQNNAFSFGHFASVNKHFYYKFGIGRFIINTVSRKYTGGVYIFCIVVCVVFLEDPYLLKQLNSSEWLNITGVNEQIQQRTYNPVPSMFTLKVRC